MTTPIQKYKQTHRHLHTNTETLSINKRIHYHLSEQIQADIWHTTSMPKHPHTAIIPTAI